MRDFFERPLRITCTQLGEYLFGSFGVGKRMSALAAQGRALDGLE